MTQAADYSTERLTEDGLSVIRLRDQTRDTEVKIAPGLGNVAYSMTVHGKPVLWSPYQSVAQFREKPVHLGIPFLAPWANRIDGDHYWANGKHYALNPELGNYHTDGNKYPIHGLLVFAAWEVTAVEANASRAQVTSRMEFWKHPDWMAQFPFAHTIEMTYRLADGALEVATTIHNLSLDAMPVSIGFHPYYQITDAPRDDWKVHLPVQEQFILTDKLAPTGEKKPNPYGEDFGLRGKQLDDVFGGISGTREFSVSGKRQKISIQYGPNYPVAVVYAPPGRDFICFEPMTGPTNVFNLDHAGIYKGMQTIAPGESWHESFWIRPTGF